MATTNHVIVPNFQPVSATNIFNQFWKTTRAMKKAGWKYLASSDGTTKDTSADPKNDKWNGGGVGTTAGVITNAGAAAASIGTPSRGRATVTGLTGIVATDKGKFLVISGGASAPNNNAHQIEEIVSGTSVRIDARNFAVVSDANNGALTWEIRDPANSSETYPTALDTVAAWWAGRGPSTLKIPITSAPVVGPSGFTFVRGENVTQASSGWEAEILGWVFDSGTGYLVCAPRLRGTGAGIYGLTDGQVVTGSVSGATVTQNGTALEYRHEMVIWKSTNQTEGSIFHCIYEPVAEAALNAFSSLALSAGATATVAPGGGGTGNAFPSFGWVAWATANTGGAAHENWNGSNSAQTIINAQIMCADLIEEQAYSADGSWTLAFGNYGVPGGGHQGYGLWRLDDTEDGDLDPYVSFNPAGSVALYTNSRTNAGSQRSAGITESFTTALLNNQSGFTTYRGWRRRGLSGDASTNYQDFEPAILWLVQSNSYAMGTNISDPEEVATAPTVVRVREPIWILSNQFGRKMRKGTLRWAYVVQGNNGTDTFDNKQWVQFSPTNVPIIVGPWDGTTTPVTLT